MTPRVAVLFLAAALAAATPHLSAQPQWQDVIRNLRHPSIETRLEAVNRLGAAGYVAAIEPVATLLSDPDDRVQAAALEAELTFFLTEPVGGSRVLGMGSSKSRAQEAFDAGPLIRSATPAPAALIDALIKAMRDENPRVRFDAVHALGFIAEPPLPAEQVRALAAELDHYDPIVRAATARVLGRLRTREAGQALINALADSSPTVRHYAVESLGRTREDRALSSLRDLIRRAGKNNTDLLVLAVARIGSPDDRDLFVRELQSKSAAARRAALEGMGRLGDRESVAVIEPLLKADKAPEVRLAAAFALQQLGQTQTHVMASMLFLPTLRTQASEYLFEIGPPAVPGLQSALAVAKDPRPRADLIQAIGYLGTSEDLPIVEPFLQDRDARVVRAATNAVVRLKRR
jgi:HEAT repeat protein